MKQVDESYDVVVCGGGLAGLSAAIAAARHGARTCLLQDRPVFGGNSSSEIRVTPHGAAQVHAYARETGIISELLIEERAKNHEPILENGWTNSVWDIILYDKVLSTPNLSCHLNTSVFAVVKNGLRQLKAVMARVANAEVELTISGKIFLDCTGDGIVAELSGCESRMGSESRDEFGEPHAPAEASTDTMGSSLFFKARDMSFPVPFQPPDWAVQHEDPRFFYEQGRRPNDVRGGYWWIEIGVPWHTIHENEAIRHELTRHVLGVWDWIKNRDPQVKELARNYGLDWIGQVPGKRESRRIMGRYLMTEHDVLNKVEFPDEVAFGGWYVDLHTPGGLLASRREPDREDKLDHTAKIYCGPYGIPLRILLARDIDNLMMAGRNVSTTHAALGTVRVQGTTAVMGQAAGTAAAIAVQRNMPIGEVPNHAISEVQQALLRDGCFLPNCRNDDQLDLARRATLTASSEDRLHGVGPHDQSESETILSWSDKRKDAGAPNLLLSRQGQLIAIGDERLDSMWVCLTNHSGLPQTVDAELVAVDHIWDYRSSPHTPLATTTLRVETGKEQWVEWPIGLTANEKLGSGRYIRLDLLPNPEIEWVVAGAVAPGHAAFYELSPGRMHRLRNGVTLSFRVDPAQACFSPSNVISGVARHYQYTNLWRSDPNLPLPQWLQLTWEEPVTIGVVQLTFPGHLLREYHAYPPLYREPLCARDYTIAAWVQGGWQEVLSIQGNYQRHRRHPLAQPIRTNQLRTLIHATNGDPAAGIFEVRCYTTLDNTKI